MLLRSPVAMSSLVAGFVALILLLRCNVMVADGSLDLTSNEILSEFTTGSIEDNVDIGITKYTKAACQQRRYLSSKAAHNESTSAEQETSEFNSSSPVMPFVIPDYVTFAKNNPFLKQIAQPELTVSAAGALLVEDKNPSKLIPRLIWIAVKDRNDELPDHLNQLFLRNPKWIVNVCDNLCKDHFMLETFRGTQISWAYSIINPLIGASRADVWRYCVLHSYGGLYLDDDSNIRTSFDEIVAADDNLIMSEEGPTSYGPCYLPSFHLSEHSTFSPERFGLNATKADFYSPNPNMNSSDADNQAYPLYFHGNTLINWAIFIKPHHPLLRRLIDNIVVIIAAEYNRLSVVSMSRWDVNWKILFCCTGFVMTYTLREMVLENSMEYQENKPRILSNNFKAYGGNVKAYSTRGDSSHYLKRMKGDNSPPYLRAYTPLTQALFLRSLEGKCVIGDAPDKTIYLISNGTRRMFPDFDTFLAYKFTSSTTKHVKNKMMATIPLGIVLESVVGKIGPGSSPDSSPSSNSIAVSSSDPGSATIPGATNLTHISTSSDVEFLSKLKGTIESGIYFNVTCWGDDYTGSRDDFLQGKFSSLITTHPVLIYPMCLRLFQLGNTLGYYLNDIACAMASGAHFIAVGNHFSLIDVDSLQSPNKSHLTFFNALPTVVPNLMALSSIESKNKMKMECTCLQYCWEHSLAPWVRNVPMIRTILLPAIDAYLSIAHISAGTILSNVTDLSTIAFKPFSSSTVSVLPLIPHVSVQYRCGDNIGFGKVKYGLLPFGAIIARIPVWARTIYVMADSPSRQQYHPFSSRCGIILKGLFDALKNAFPSAIVVVKRGGDQFLDYARLAYSNVTICSSSTFCLWPALANNGDVYFPLTALVANSGSNATAKDLGPRFHWIRDIEMVRNFKQFKPWNKVMDVLEGRMENY